MSEGSVFPDYLESATVTADSTIPHFKVSIHSISKFSL